MINTTPPKKKKKVWKAVNPVGNWEKHPRHFPCRASVWVSLHSPLDSYFFVSRKFHVGRSLLSELRGKAASVSRRACLTCVAEARTAVRVDALGAAQALGPRRPGPRGSERRFPRLPSPCCLCVCNVVHCNSFCFSASIPRTTSTSTDSCPTAGGACSWRS